MKAIVRIPNITWRDGRPRFNPGPELRALGWKGEDLRHLDARGKLKGAWFTLRETEDWANARAQAIAAQIASGKKRRPKAAPKPAAYTMGDLFKDLWASRRFQTPKGTKTPPPGMLSFKSIEDYKSKARVLQAFDADLWNFPVKLITKPLVKGLHEKLWEHKTLNMANAMLAVLRLAFSYGVDHGKLETNPALKLRLPGTAPRLRVATPFEIDTLLRWADAPDANGAHRFREVGDAIMLALYTGQRRADVLELEERNEDSGKIRFIQNKTGARVRVRAMPQLVARLANIRQRKQDQGRTDQKIVVLHPTTAKPFRGDTFAHLFTDLRSLAAQECPSLKTFNFQDLRDTAVTRLATSGCTMPEIAAITGHSLETINTIVKHYLQMNEAQADAAITKLQAWMEQEGIAL